MPDTKTSSSKSLSVIHTVKELQEQLANMGWWKTPPYASVPARWLMRNEQRFDAGHYANDAFIAQQIVRDSGLIVQRLDHPDITQEIYILGRFKRIYASNKEASWPYLSASEVLTFRPMSNRWIAKDHAPKEAKKHFAQEGWILMSCSGSVGRMVIVTKRLERYFLTHDLARIVPNPTFLTGYLYAFLSSSIGQAILTKDQYGSAIKHLEAHHIAGVSVPLMPIHEQEVIHNQIMRAYALREEANLLLDEAEEMLYAELGLPRFDENLVPYLSPPLDRPTNFPMMPHPRAFTVRAADLHERFDASYHVPVAQTAISLLHKAKYPAVQLGKMAKSIFIPPRFKRIYVPKEYGVPFLRPSQLGQIYPYDKGYISKLTAVLDELSLRKGDVLVTTDGTIGRVALTTSQITGWAGSNNIARISYGNFDNRNGYLVAFLSSPYGYHQLIREVYGGVIDHIEVPHIANIWIPDAPLNIQQNIGQHVVNAFEKKNEASVIEEAAIKRVEDVLERGKTNMF
jgi:type I restriction enzyme, S subunit